MEDTSEKGGFYSAAELAALKLPDFPTTDRAARTRAEAEGWPFVVVKSRGAKGETKKFKPPINIQEIIASGERSGFPSPKPYSAPAPVISLSVQQERHYNVAEPGPSNPDAEINAHLFWLCHEACLQVYGEAFSKENVQVQINYSIDLYNLLLRLSSAKRANAGSNPQDFNRLDSEDMAAQLRLFVQMGWVKPFPPPPSHPKQLIF